MKRKGPKYACMTQRISRLAVGECLELSRYPNDPVSKNRLRCGVAANRRGRYLRFTLTSLKPVRGLRIQRKEDWPGPVSMKMFTDLSKDLNKRLDAI
jgi:hypothetical protein